MSENNDIIEEEALKICNNTSLKDVFKDEEVDKIGGLRKDHGVLKFVDTFLIPIDIDSSIENTKSSSS